MSYWNIQRPFMQDKPIVGSHHFSAEKSVNVDRETVGKNKYGVRAVPAGLFIARVGGVDRFLPRDFVREDAVATNSAQVKVSLPEVFKVGDTLYATEPEGLVTLDDTWAAGDTVKITFTEPSLGIQVAYTHTQVGANLAALDDELVAALNLGTNPLSEYARFEVGTEGQIKVFSRGLVFSISVVADTDGDGTAAVTNQLNAVPRLVGEIAFIDYENQLITLADDAAVAVGVGGHVGTLVEDIYGIYNHSIDFTDKPTCVIKAIDRCDRIYTIALPYFDHQLMAKFPRLKFA